MYPEHEYSDIRDKILEGIRRAVEKLIIKTAKEGGELVFSENGKIKIVKAKDLLSKNT